MWSFLLHEFKSKFVVIFTYLRQTDIDTYTYRKAI